MWDLEWLQTFSEFALPIPSTDESPLCDQSSPEEGLTPITGEDVVVVTGGLIPAHSTLVDITLPDVSDLFEGLLAGDFDLEGGIIIYRGGGRGTRTTGIREFLKPGGSSM